MTFVQKARVFKVDEIDTRWHIDVNMNRNIRRDTNRHEHILRYLSKCKKKLIRKSTKNLMTGFASTLMSYYRPLIGLYQVKIFNDDFFIPFEFESSLWKYATIGTVTPQFENLRDVITLKLKCRQKKPTRM